MADRRLRLLLGRPLGFLRTTRPLLAVAAAAVAVELGTAAAKLPELVQVGREQGDGGGFLVRDADLDPLSFFMPTAALALARQTIPRDATYAVAVGDDPPVSDPGVVRRVFRFWLLPRRYTTRIRDAEWVVAYHRSSESLGVRYRDEIGLGPDANVVRVLP